MAKSPLVSIRLMVYNNEEFIIDALEGILKQQVDFDYEVVVGDDFSSDNTLNIIKSYALKYPNLFKILDRKVGDNYYLERQIKGRVYNFTNIINNCSGKYIALLDGDDYWTDPQKLQKQVNFLEANKEYSMCFHNAYYLFEDQGKKLKPFRKKGGFKKTYTTEDTFGHWFIPTASIVFRKPKDFSFPFWYESLASADMALISILSGFGNIGCIDDYMSIYRIHGGGVSNSHKGLKILRFRLHLFENLNTHFKGKYSKEVDEITKKLVMNYIKSLPFSKIISLVLGWGNLWLKKSLRIK